MKFKSPGETLWWMSILMIIGGFTLGFFELRDERIITGSLLFFVAVLAALLWFDVRWAAVPLMVLGTLAIVGVLIQLATKPFDWRFLSKLIMNGYFLHALWVWFGKRHDRDDLPEEWTASSN